MNAKFFRVGGALAGAAALSLSATPALARSGVYVGSSWGWSSGWGGWGRHRHDDIGDILAGVLIVGGIAAVANAAANADRNRHAPPPPYRYPGAPDERRGANYGDDRPEWQAGGSIDAAVDRCVGEVARGDAQVDQVDRVNREGDGWRIDGRLRSGQSFGCAVGRDGHISSATVDGRAVLPGN